MRLTARDVRLVRDVALSHVMSRDQVIGLGYFGSVTRANTRLLLLRNQGLLRRLRTPFFGQGLYVAGQRSPDIVGEKIARIVSGRSQSPRFVQHALSVTNVRVYLTSRGADAWRFEQQASCSFRYGGRDLQVRPDGLAVFEDGLTVVEVDLGHVAPAKFREKLRAFDAFVASGECLRSWREPAFTLLVVTTGKLRASRLARLVPSGAGFRSEFRTFDQLGISCPGSWS